MAGKDDALLLMGPPPPPALALHVESDAESLSLDLALTFVSWAAIWVLILFKTPEGGLQTQPTDSLTLNVLTTYHIATPPLLICFYWRNWTRMKRIRFSTFEQKGFFIIGVVASFANIGVNILSECSTTAALIPP